MEIIRSKTPLGFQWPTQDPFLFCAHHEDYYPEGNDHLGPKEPLTGRHLGSDFDLENPWKMYHGRQIPGFPVHPHRGFETVTIVLEGFVDHFDSGGWAGRYGQGDVQWMTAGSGLQHAEMFPLLNQDGPNTLHLFQIWLNLPKKDKFVAPHYKMLWHEDIPKVKVQHQNGTDSQVTVIAGDFQGTKAVSPTPNSWATDPQHKTGIFLITLRAGETIVLPKGSESMNRSLYFYRGDELTLSGQEILPVNHMAVLTNESTELRADRTDAYVLILESEPINEPVVQYGPFVMNTRQEINDAYADYEKTQFGMWPWQRPDPVHPAQLDRMAIYGDGTRSYPPTKEE